MSRFAPMKSPTNKGSKSPIRNVSPKNNNSNNNFNSFNNNSNNNNSNNNNNRKENEIPITLLAPTHSSSIKEKDPIVVVDPLPANTQANKRKSFVTIVKPVEIFGEPPPIPRPTYNYNNNISPEKVVINNEQNVSSVINAARLQKQSVRWLNLSATFWYLIVIDTDRTVNKENLSNFFEVIKWRAHDKINEDEFSALYSEWISKNNGNSSRRSVVGIFTVRQMLIENSCSESDLDLYIGMIMNETNKYTLHVPINYIPRIDSVHYQPQLELVSSKWLNLAEELFFCLDSPGYGVLRFDEIFFFSSCLAIGLQGWQNESELETDLSLGLLSAITLQLLRDMGANIQLTSLRQELISLGHSDLEVTVTGSENVLVDGIVNRPIRNGASISPLKQPINSYKRQSITMRMFKQYFLKKGINEGTLAALVVHVKMCIERLARITSSKSASLFAASKPLENQRVIGSPRLWQQAVLLAFGYNSDYFEKNKNSSTPPILLFLLSDADKLISGALRAYENPLDNIDSSLQNTTSQSFRRVRLSTYEEMHETCHRIWSAFKNWGVNKTKGVYAGFSNSESISDKHSDPIYQLIVSTMIEYKNLQLQLCAALYDLTMTHYGLQNSSNPISFVCSSLVPNAEAMIVELGLDEVQDYVVEQEIVEVETELKQKSPESITNVLNKNSMKIDTNTILKDYNKQNSSTSPTSNEKPPVAFKSLYLEFESNKSLIKEESTRESFSKDPRSKPEGRADLVRKAQWERIFDSREEEKYPIDNNNNMENKSTNNNVFRDSMDVSYDDVLRNISNDEQVSSDASVLKFQQQEAIILQQLLSCSNLDEQQAYITKLRQRLGVDNSISYSSNNNNNETITKNNNNNNDIMINKVIIDKVQNIDESNSNSDNEMKFYENVSNYSIPYTQQLQDNNLYSISTDEILENNYIENYNDNGFIRVDSPMTYSNKSEASVSTNGPSTIADLLETDQSAGKYAQGLREILRKMAKNDSKVKVQSLEQVIKLGQEIIIKESPKQTVSSSSSSSKLSKRFSMPSELDTSHNISNNNTPIDNSNNNSGNSNNSGKNKLNQRRNTTIELTALRRHMAHNYITPSKNDGNSNSRTIKSVPGRVPEQKNNDNKKAFGHRL